MIDALESSSYEVWAQTVLGNWQRVAAEDGSQTVADRAAAHKLGKAFTDHSGYRRTMVIRRTLEAEYNCAGLAGTEPVPPPLPEETK
jgi:predicted secreted protein